ncbi:hypothetical protein WG66_012808 [Moniliophthora roreri]|nr:hypothetical protein WG66_012808 [Moniliophthora roreri]
MVKGPAELAQVFPSLILRVARILISRCSHGPMFIGGVLTILLFGISVTQTYIYWDAYKNKDRWFIKYFVLLLFIADVVHCVFIVVYLYDAVIKHFDDVSFLATSNWVFNTEPALSGMISGMVQAFFGWRVKVLTGSWILLAIIQFCSAAAFLMGIATAIACGIVKSFADFQKFQVVVIIWLVCATLADIIITVTLVIHLKRHKTGFKNTDSHLDRIIRCNDRSDWSCNRRLGDGRSIGVPIGPYRNVRYSVPDRTDSPLDANETCRHLIFNCVLPKLYTNSLLSSLNSRGGWRYNDSENTSTKHSQNDIGLRRFGPSENVVNLSSSRPEVFVHVESRETVDHSGKRDQSIFAEEGKSGWQDGVTV